MKPCHLLLLLLLPTLPYLAAADVSWTNCPAACRCRWVSGRKLAECTNASLSSVPANLSSEIQVIDLSHNAFPSLPADAFRFVMLVNLHKVFLRRCGISHVDKHAFSGLEILIELDLSWNLIRSLHPLTFRDNVRLRILHVNHNPLQKLEDGLFNGLTFLQTVDVSDCQLTYVGRKTFVDVPKLHDLKLSRNNLTTVKLAAFEHIHSLLSLVLFGNPWRCDCHLKPFLDWTIHRNLYTPPTTCEEPPQLRGRLWSDLAAGDLACRPQVRVPMSIVETSGPNATLPCRASGSPMPELHWVFNSRTITNNTRRAHGRRKYSTAESVDAARWLNLTVIGVSTYDVGNYTCVAQSPGGSVGRNVTLRVSGVLVGVEGSTMRKAGYPARTWALVLGLCAGAALFAAAVAALVLRLCRRRGGYLKKPDAGGEAPSGRHRLDSSCEEKFLLTAVNPIQKPPRRIDRALVTNATVERSEVTLNLLDNGAAYQACSSSEDQQRADATPQPQTVGGGGGVWPYPPDLLPFPAHEAADDPGAGTEGSPLLARRSPPGGGQARRPRVVSWTEGSATFDNLGPRTTADGSSALSLDKQEEELGDRPPRAWPRDSVVVRLVAGRDAVVLARKARLAHHRNSWSAADTPRAAPSARTAYLAIRDFDPAATLPSARSKHKTATPSVRFFEN